jgi:uncharacterized protein (DUF2249 family)
MTRGGHIEEMSAEETREEFVTVDVREDIRHGREPFSKIMDAVENLKPGETLLLINSFEPRPLYRVMANLGFSHWSEETATGDWKIYFRREPDRGPLGALPTSPPQHCECTRNE